MRRERRAKQRKAIVSFSGIDGAGKSTQIEILCTRLRQAGLRVRLLSFWDDVALLTNWRQFTSHTVFGSEQGVGAPGQPVERRDKNVRAWYMTPIRFLLYLLDCLSLCLVVADNRAGKEEVVVFDRYLYDELANLPLQHPVSRTVVGWLLKLSPEPDVAYFLDADPEQARERKPEYPVEFLQSNRASYLRLSGIAGMHVIASGTVAEVSAQITRALAKKLPVAGLDDSGIMPAPSGVASLS